MEIVSVMPVSSGFQLKVKVGAETITVKTFWDNDGVDKVTIDNHTYEVVGLSRLVRLT